jgi:hypothetical protein
MRFLTTYASDLSSNPQIDTLTTSLVDLIAFCLSAGDTFLPDPGSYDDLFYKLVETGPILARYREAYTKKKPLSHPSTTSGPSTERPPPPHHHSIDTLINVSTHFHSLLFLPEKDKSDDAASSSNPTTGDSSTTASPVTPAAIATIKKKSLSPREVHEIIRQGYDTLSIQSHEGLNTWEKWREADRKLELKRIARCAVEDVRKVVFLHLETE